MDPQAMLDQIEQEESLAIKAAPIVRKLAQQDGVDLSQVTGSGKNGTITKADYEAFMGKSAPEPKQRQQRAPMNHMTDDTYESGGMKFTRQRAGLDHSSKKTLDVPKQYLNPELEYRWVNEGNGRAERLREYGYQNVDPATLSKDEQISVRRRVGARKDGSDQHAILMAIPKKWYQERHEKAEEARSEKELGMFRSPSDEAGPLGKDFYNKGSRLR